MTEEEFIIIIKKYFSSEETDPEKSPVYVMPSGFGQNMAVAAGVAMLRKLTRHGALPPKEDGDAALVNL